MFKLGKTSLTKTRLIPSVFSCSKNLPQRGIVGKNLTLSLSTTKRDLEYYQDVYGSYDSLLGIIKLNKEHRFNTLSPTHCNEVHRGLETMYLDSVTRAILITTEKGQHWSNGTDFRTLMHMVKEGQLDKVASYLEQLYKLQTLAAKCNKPIVAVGPGHAFNSGASLLSATGHPLMTSDSKMAFNECTFGFVPHSGATYYLSRLPGEFGTFMALTGLPIHGLDAKKIGLVDNIVNQTKDFEYALGDIIFSMEPKPFTHSVFFQENASQSAIHNIPVNKQLETRLEDQYQMATSRDRRALFENAAKQGFIPEFKDIDQRIPRLKGESEFNYFTRLQAEQKKNATEIPGYLDNEYSRFDKGMYQVVDSYGNLMTSIKEQLFTHCDQDGTNIVQHSDLIARCFYPSSLEEIKQRLSEEKDPFAKKCLQAIERNSELSMQLALKMLRKAINLDYTSCLQMEIDVASNVLTHAQSSFNIGVQSVLMTPKPRGQKFHSKPEYPTSEQSTRDLDSFFEPQAWAKEVHIDTVKHALLPTRHFYQRFSDVVRLWINEESTPQEEVREDFDYAAKSALRGLGVDVRDGALTMQDAREHLYAKIATERKEIEENLRMMQLLTDDKLSSEYFAKIKIEMDKLKIDSHFDEKVDRIIENIFEEAAVERFINMYDKSKEAQQLDKRRFFLRLKKFLFQSRCLVYGREEFENLQKRAENYAFKLPHMTEGWEQNWRDVEHPDLHRSPLYYVSKAIGKISMTPIELTKEYLTNPDRREDMTALTIDENQLLALQEDIYVNTQKYISIFSKPEVKAHDPFISLTHRDRGRQELRLRRYEYWYRMYNDGRSPLDDLVYESQYTAYQGWMETLEDKAIDTLKMAVDMLLRQTQKDRVVFNAEQEGTKRQQLEKLLGVLNGQIENTSLIKKNKKANQKRGGLRAKTRKLEEISKILNDVLKQDPILKHIFDQEDDSSSNEYSSLRETFREEAMNDLLKLIEITLVDKQVSKLDKTERSILEKRLASLLQPRGLDDKHVTSQQLTLIDAYLADANEQSVIQEAVDLVKPFFFQQIKNKLFELGVALGKMLTVDDTHNIILIYYYMQKIFPGMEKRETMQKYMAYSHKQFTDDLIFNAMPMMSPEFGVKDMLNNWMMPEDIREWKKKTLDERMADNMRQTQERLEQLEKLEQNFVELHKSYEQQKETQGKLFETGDEDIRKFEHFWTEAERHDIEVWEKQLFQVEQFLLDHRYEIQNHFTPFDWLRLYSESILDMNVDMNSVLRLETQDRKAAFQGNQGLSQESWELLAKEAKKFANLFEAIVKYEPEMNVNLQEFMASHEPTKKANEASIFQKAIEFKNDYIQSRKEQLRADRSVQIKRDITDFKELQSKHQNRELLKARVNKLALLQPGKVQDFIQEVMKGDCESLDLEKLASKLERRDSNVLDLTSVIDQNQLINNYKSGQISGQILSTLAQTQTDAVSLAEASILASQDNSLDALQKSQLKAIIDYVQDHLAYVSHAERQKINVDSFIFNNHFSDSSAYNDYSSSVLERKIRSVLGDNTKKEFSDNTQVDWEFAETRTSPSDHSQLDVNQQNDYLKSTIKGDKKNFNNLTEEISSQESVGLRSAELKKVIEDARNLTRIPDDMEQHRNYFQNKLLWAMTQTQKADEGFNSVNQIIEEYLEARMKVCMLNSDFQHKVKNTTNGHIYLKALRERVFDELEVLQETTLDKLTFEKHTSSLKDKILYDLESPYNMQSVNNTQALGYDNLEARGAAQNASEQFDAAHSQVFDKMLADYYLAQRGQFAETNKVFQELTKIYDEKNKHNVRTDLKNYGLVQTKLELNRDKDEGRTLNPNFGKIFVDLDIATHRAIQKGKNGLGEELRELSITETDHPLYCRTQIPEYFDSYDVRKSPQQYVEDKLFEIVNNAFQTRRKMEKNMSRRELYALDQVLAQYLNKENLIKVLNDSINEDYGSVMHGSQIIQQYRDSRNDIEKQELKKPSDQRDFNRKIKNEDALYKQIAFGAMQEQKNREIIEGKNSTAIERGKVVGDSNTFEYFYQHQLGLDATQPSREINPKDFEAKKIIRAKDAPPPSYKSDSQLREEYWKDFSLFKENKKEQIDRTELFYVLEQFYQGQKENPNAESEAQKHIREYFSNPDNTYFYDKNKIQ